MKVGTPGNVTRVLGEAQGYAPLPVEDAVVNMMHADGSQGDTPVMFTVWHPTPKELAALQSGGHIVLGIVGTMHPPVMVYVANMEGVVVEDGAQS